MNHPLTGAWIYRSFRNVEKLISPDEPLGKELLFGQGELVFDPVVGHDDVKGQIAFRSDPPKQDDPRLELEGRIEHGSPHQFTMRASGLSGTTADGWVYDYIGFLVPDWPNGVGQTKAMVGSVIRSVEHGQNSPAGVVASFVAVERTFPEPREVIPLPARVIEMLASEQHRLHHLLWHSLRQFWTRASDENRKKIEKLHWKPPRLAIESGNVAVNNGSGVDFLYMHREMIGHVRHKMNQAGLDPIAHWNSPPAPSAIRREPDFSSASPELPAPGNSDGFVVPPVWHTPNDSGLERRLSALKSDEYYWSRMRWWDREFKNPERLLKLTLGQLGALLEFSIHNDMHMRWASIPRDPDGVPLPLGRAIDDIDERWADPSNDYLGDFYSSHVNPVFWRVHGWVDDRIEGWFQAHEAAHPGEIQRCDVGGVKWFKSVKWIETDKPWSRPENGVDVQTMKQVVAHLFAPEDSIFSVAAAHDEVTSKSATSVFFGTDHDFNL